MALGIYLRKFIIDYLENEQEVGLDTQFFGKFALVKDHEANQDSMYPKKLVFETNAMMSS